MSRKTTFIFLFIIGVNCYGQDGFIEGEPALAYWKIGDKKEVVIALHGGPAATHQYLRPEFDGLSKAAQVIYYDQRGCGKSQQATGYHWKEHVKDLDRVINRFAKDKKVFLAGSSWGTFLAMLYTYTYPEKVKGLILSGTVSWEGKGLDSITIGRYTVPHAVKTYKYTMPEYRLASGIKKETGLTQVILPIQKEIEIYSGPPSGETRHSLQSAPVLDSLRKIMQPVLLFNGNDPDCRIDRAHLYATIFPNAELYTIPAACHDPWFSDPEKFADRCAVFIRKVRKMK
ncbi:alpha/beta fold hydrolase [Runella sp.]|uniref:alpha/beta fold hydrolase n=1 Tax=Runella sp. TaxID=1960881 RepID=UPI003D111F1F